MCETILQLRNSGHAVLLMLDANGTIEDDPHLRKMIANSGLFDLHRQGSAPSTFIGASNRRIDLMLRMREGDGSTNPSGHIVLR
jgi:hypothetical protein